MPDVAVRDAAASSSADPVLPAQESHLLRVFLEHSSEAFFASRVSDGRIVYANEQGVRLLGYSMAELLSMTVMQISAVYDAMPWQQRVQQYRAKGRVVFETVHRAKDGHLVPVEVSLSYVPGACGDHTVGVVRSLEQHRRTSAALRAANERWEYAIEATDRGVWDWRIDTDEVYFSPKWKGLLGFRDDELDNQLQSWFGRIHPDDVSMVQAELQRHLQGETGNYSCDQRVRRKDGSYAWMLVRAKVIEAGGDGLPQRMVGTFTDISERKQAELVQQTRVAVLDRIVHTAEVDTVLADIAARLEAVHPDWRVSIVLVDPHTHQLRTAAAPSLPAWYCALVDQQQPGPQVGSCGTAIHLGESVLASDLRSNPNWQAFGEVVQRLGLRACWSVPFKDDGGVVRGSFAVYKEAPGLPSAAELSLISEFCRLASLAEQRVRAGTALRQAAAVLESTHDGVVVTDLTASIVSVNRAYCEMAGYGEGELIGQRPSLLRSGRHDQAFYQAMWRHLGNTGHWQGEIWNRRKNGHIYPQWVTISTVHDDRGEPSHYVGVCTDISQIKHSEQRLQQLAHYDPLTGLPNRLLAHSRLRHALEQAVRKNGLLAVLFIDLDRFKTVNDSLGHPAGDQLLAGFAARATKRLREADTLARLGGDEFLLILEDLEHPDDAAMVAQSLLETLETPFTLDSGQEIYVSASVGLSLYPEDGLDADELIQHADTAMYQAKAQGRNTFRFYTEALTRHAHERLALELQMRRALQQNEFVLHYQPLIDIQGSGTVAVEALLRWQHPQQGLVAPARFIALAEETGLILPLGDWVLRTACRQAKVWLDAGQGLTVAVNLSARQFLQLDLVEKVRGVLAETCLPAAHLELEITESVIMERPEAAIETLRGLRSLGVQLSIDDFGTGYSSLAYLKRFPIHKLKIDRSFIDGLPVDRSDQAIVRATITMAHTLGIRTLAEGVETAEQLQVLRQLQCDYSQGFLFSRALPSSELEQWLVGPGAVLN
jgi:diguanylate cyclase (GGDEF)-like protein/PAS domain S-box-containing protein